MNAMLSRGLIAVLLVAAVIAAARADDPKISVANKDLDFAINSFLLDSITVGVKLYNDGDEDGCCRVYQRALVATIPLLDHRAQLKKTVADKLIKANDLKSTEDRAWAMRAILNDIRLATKGVETAPVKSPTAPVAPATTAKKTLWDRLGGESAVKKVVHDFVVSAAADPKVNFDRTGQYKPKDVPALEQRIVEFVSQVTGGTTLKYTGRDMKEAHAGMKITEDEFNAMVGHVETTLKKNNVPQKEMNELLAIVKSTKDDIVEVKK